MAGEYESQHHETDEQILESMGFDRYKREIEKRIRHAQVNDSAEAAAHAIELATKTVLTAYKRGVAIGHDREYRGVKTV